jgi:hypothetical protein
VTVTCTDPAFETTLDFAPGDLGPKTVSGIPLDGDGENSCSVSETDTGTTPSGWTLVVSYSPPDGENGNSAAQTVNADTSPSFTVTNTYSQLPGALDLEKVVSGPVPAGTEFEVTVSCSLENVVVDGFPVVVTFDENGDVVPPPPLPLTDIPAGAECSVEETGTGGAIAVTYSPDGGTPSDPPTVTIVANDTVSVTVTNTFGEVGGEFSGSVNVQKAVVGGPPADDTQFVVNVHCVGVTVDVSQDITLVYPDELEGSLSFEAPSIESVECTVIEKDPLGGAVKATISPNDGVVTLTVNAPVADVVVTNDYGDPVVGVGGATAVRDVLPFTGSTFDMLLKSAGLVLVAGTATWLGVRRRRRAPSPLS